MKPPMGVRAAETMTMGSFMMIPLLLENLLATEDTEATEIRPFHGSGFLCELRVLCG